MAEAALLDEAIRRGREGPNGGLGRKPVLPPAFKAKKPASPSTLPELQEQLRRKKALLADREVIDELPDKGARIRANIAELEKRIATLQRGSEVPASTEPLEESMKVLSLGSAKPAAQAASSQSPSSPSNDVALTRIPNPLKGSVPAPNHRQVDEQRRLLGIYGRREMADRQGKQREVKILSLGECQQAEAHRQAKEKEWMINEARNRLKAAATPIAPTERGEGDAWTAIRAQPKTEEESDDDADLPPIEDGQEGVEDDDEDT